MTWLEFILRLSVLALSAAYLLLKHHQRELRRLAECEARFQQLAASVSPVDFATLAPRLRMVRENHLAASHPPPGEAHRKTTRVAAAREVIRRRDYFHPGDAFEEHQLAAKAQAS
jgi:hypothetical protein